MSPEKKNLMILISGYNLKGDLNFFFHILIFFLVPKQYYCIKFEAKLSFANIKKIKNSISQHSNHYDLFANF